MHWPGPQLPARLRLVVVLLIATIGVVAALRSQWLLVVAMALLLAGQALEARLRRPDVGSAG